MTLRLTVATRKSQLALAQTRAFVASLRASHPEVEVTELLLTTTGDRIHDRALTEVGGKGLFVKEIEEALLEERADLAVHSFKDVPAGLAPSLAIVCVPAREDPRDAIVTRLGEPLRALPVGALLGTSSLRRRVQLQQLAPQVKVVPIRGNVDTRLRKCRDGIVAATVLARAGLLRLGMTEVTAEILDVDECLPAVGQGALAIEARAQDARIAELLAPLSDLDTARTVASERGVLKAVEGSCTVPVAAHAVRDTSELWLRGMLADPEGTAVRYDEVRVPWPASDEEAEQVGIALGAKLRRQATG